MRQYTTVPELSLSDYVHGNTNEKAEFADSLYEGFRYFGFIILRDHGISEDLLNQAYSSSANFFALPESEKMKCDSGVGGQRGYTAFGREHAKGSTASDLKEFWHVGREFPAEDPLAEIYPPNMWPDAPADFRETFLALYDGLEEVGHVMLEALAPSLGLNPDYFRKLAVNGNSILRLLHYPPIPDGAEPGAMRAAAHEDINLITLLVAASSAGLELLDRDGNWLPVEGSRNAVIVDAGDMLARITNNRTPATTHRVVNPDGPNISRYSMPFFMHPRADAVLSCIKSCRDGSEDPDIIANEFLQQRLREIGLTT